MSNPFRAERLDPKDADLRRADALSDGGDGEPPLDPRVVQRSISTLRDRVRMQDDEIDHLRAMIRSVHHLSSSDQVTQLTSRLDRLESKGPESSEAAVNAKIAKLEAHLEAETETLSARLFHRVSALESSIGEQVNTADQLREVMQRTDTNLARLIIEVDRLVTEVGKRPERLSATEEDPALADIPEILEYDAPREPGRWKVPVVILGVFCLLGIGVWFLFTQLGNSTHSGGAHSDSSSALSPIEQARVYESKKDYPKAEAIYRELLRKDPDNGEVIRHLASVLFRQDKWDESATILKKLSGGDNNPNNANQ